MELDWGGSSTESEYFDGSDDDEPEFLGVLSRAALGAGDQAAQWNNILTPGVAAAAERAAVLASRRNTAEPLAIPLDPPVEMLPRSTEFVSPFAPLSQPKPTVKMEKREPEETAARGHSTRRVVVDLSLDSDEDDDETDSPTSPETPTPGPMRSADSVQPSRAETAAPSSERPPEPVTPNADPPMRRATESFGALSVAVPTQSAPDNVGVRSSGRDYRSPAPRPQNHDHRPPQLRITPRRTCLEEDRSRRTLSCTRCRRLIPNQSVAQSRSLIDCKCCGRTYPHEEFSVRGANRRCHFCQPAVSINRPNTGTHSVAIRPMSVSQSFPTSPRIHLPGNALTPRPSAQSPQDANSRHSSRQTPKSPGPTIPTHGDQVLQLCTRCHRYRCVCKALAAHGISGISTLRQPVARIPSARASTATNESRHGSLTKERRSIALTAKTPPVRRRRSSKQKKYQQPISPMPTSPREQRYLTYARNT